MTRYTSPVTAGMAARTRSTGSAQKLRWEKPVTLTTAEGEIDYVVDSVTTHNEDTLKDSDIWEIVPNRLVLVSCFIEDLWGRTSSSRPHPCHSGVKRERYGFRV